MPKKIILRPAELAAKRFGGVRKLGRLLGYEFLVAKWISRGGHIPSTNDNHRRLLSLAKEQGVKLSAEEIVLGGEQ